MPHGGTCLWVPSEAGMWYHWNSFRGSWGIWYPQLQSRRSDCFIWDHFSTGYTPGSRAWAWRHGTLWVGITQRCHRSLSPWTDLAFLRAGVPLEQVSWHTVAKTARAGALHATSGSLGALDRAPTTSAHQMLRAVGSAFSLTAVPATAIGQARVSPHGQHRGCLVHQPAGRYTITPHVTARPPSPPLESHTVQVTARCSHPGEA